jgi:hypothetical protein
MPALIAFNSGRRVDIQLVVFKVLQSNGAVVARTTKTRAPARKSATQMMCEQKLTLQGRMYNNLRSFEPLLDVLFHLRLSVLRPPLKSPRGDTWRAACCRADVWINLLSKRGAPAGAGNLRENLSGGAERRLVLARGTTPWVFPRSTTIVMVQVIVRCWKRTSRCQMYTTLCCYVMQTGAGCHPSTELSSESFHR